MNASTRALTLALSVALVGCAAPSTLNPEHLITSDADDAAQLSVVYPPDRREGYALIYPGSCEKSPFGSAYAEPIYRSIFRGPPDDALSIKVKPLTPITLSYSFYISDTTCRVAASALLMPYGKYTVIGQREFKGSIIAISSGCSIQVIDQATQQQIPLFPPMTQPGAVRCTPAQ